MTLRIFLIGLVVVAAAALAGCGGSTSADTPTGPMTTTAPAVAVAATRPVAAVSLTRADVERRLGNSFRAGLRRLAAVSQPVDEGADLGQPLPSGQLRDVACAPGGSAAQPWDCTVRWATVERRAVVTRYRVRVTARGCFSAGADPALPQRRDATAGTISEDPLNALFGLGRAC